MLKKIVSISLIGIFVGVIFASLFAQFSPVMMFIGEILLIVSFSFLIIYGLHASEGILGIVFGVLLSLGFAGGMLYMVWPPFFPTGVFHDNVLIWLFAPLLICGGGGAGVTKIIIIICF